MFSNNIFDRKEDLVIINYWDEGKSNPHAFYKPVDDYTSRDFARNYGGHPRSDIALLNEQTDLTAVNWLLDKLQQRPSDGVGSEISDSELSIAHKSKYCQTAAEMIQYYDDLLRIRDERELAQIQEKDRAEKEKEFAERRRRLRESLSQDELDSLRKVKRQKEIDELLDD